MITSPPFLWKVAALAAAGFVFVPAARGVLLLAAAIALIATEAHQRYAARGKRIELLVDGQLRKVPPEGGFVTFGGGDVEVTRVGDRVSVDGQLMTVGDVVFRGSSLLEVLR